MTYGQVRRVPIEIAQPKYAVLVNTIQQRIADGTYPAGSKLPSETELIEEFTTSRPMVVRALEILKQDGWIDSRQGKGRFVRARPALDNRQVPQYAGDLLDGEESAQVRLVRVGPVLASAHAAAALGVAEGTPLIARTRLVTAEIGPVELSTVYLPVELASGTEVGKDAPIPGGLLRHIVQVKGVEFDHAVQRISARHASTEEASRLKIRKLDVVLTLLLVAYDRAGVPLLCVDAVLPASRHELEDAFPLS